MMTKETETLEHPQHVLLIATVGSTPEPLAASIMHWKPAKVVFVPSRGTRDKTKSVLKLLCNKQYRLGEGEYEDLVLSDEQDFSQCVQEMQFRLKAMVKEWIDRSEGDNHCCVVDFTGGTKCMSAALAMVARTCRTVQFSYVGGSRRDKDDVGIVISGKEQVVYTANPWSALGYQVVEDAVVAFNHHDYGEGAQWLNRALRSNVRVFTRKSELCALAKFMEGYDLWNRIEYKGASDRFRQCDKSLNDLAAALEGIVEKMELQQHLDKSKCRLEKLKKSRIKSPSGCTRELLEDLIANAERRKEKSHHVDAVARLYRAIELAAQLRLWETYKIDTAKVPLEEFPESMRRRLEPNAEDGKMKIGLQDAYKLLNSTKDELGQIFTDELKWNTENKKSPLTARNQSIAGHGFSPVSPEITESLWKGLLRMVEVMDIKEDQIFRFPKLGE